MHFWGHFSAHFPQAVQSSGLICARLSSTVIAQNSHCFWQSLQPIQPTAQAFFTVAPLSVFEHITFKALLAGIIFIIFLGQAVTHFRQPAQSSSLTLAVPFTIESAPLSHAFAQSPRPKHPKLQADGPE